MVGHSIAHLCGFGKRKMGGNARQQHLHLSEERILFSGFFLYMRLPGKSAAFPLTTADFCVILYFEDKSREHTVQRGIGWCKISGEARGYHLAEENGGFPSGSYKLYKNEVKARVEPCGFFSHPGQTHESPSALCICLSGAFCLLGEFYGGIAYVYRYFSRKTSIL